ncbi:MAG: metal-dependent hydrolase [Halodesulfurarchaeum sp.]|nr:metal-dependent hydrolase [Halodesulfurarchaeum sp.]
MYRTGHYGVALSVYAPLAFLLLAAGFEALALIGGVIVIGGAMLPDVDQRLPFVAHRGFTHTIWFALLLGLLSGAVVWIGGFEFGPHGRAGLAAFGFVIGTLTIAAHLFADALTPMGIQPFAPFGNGSCTIGVTRAGNPVGNAVLLVLGLVLASVAVLAGEQVTLG